MEKSENEKMTHIKIPPFLQRVLPRTISGIVNSANHNAIDWGFQGFVALGVQTAVVIVDPRTIQCAQTLTKHQSPVVNVKWRKTKHYHTLSASYTLVLASADQTGTIHVWNVAGGETISTLQDGNRQISEMAWLGAHDGSEYLLAALHPPYSLVLWDTRHGSKVWKKSYTESLTLFSFDPFHLSNMAFLCQGCILLVEDFRIAKCPSSNGKRFFVSVPLSPARTSSISSEEKTATTIRNKMKQLVAGDVKPKNDDGAQMQDCVQLLYHQSCHDILILVFAREVLLIDLLIKQTIGIISPDRNMASIVQVASCWQRDVIICLHESGSISGHFRKKDPNHQKSRRSDNIAGQTIDVLYEKKCHSEPLRLGRGKEPLGFCMNPITETNFGFLLGPGDSRLVFKELLKTPTAPSCFWDSSCMQNPDTKDPIATSLDIKDNHFSQEFPSNIFKNGFPKLPDLSIAQMVPPTFEVNESVIDGNCSLRMMITGLLPSMMPATTIRMCPPLTTKNINSYVPLMASGNQAGEVQIVNLATGVFEREFSLHTCPVRGLEWTSLTSFLSFGHQALTNAQGRVRNELIHTDVRTGYSMALRTNRNEESPIEMIRVSYLKQYFIVILANDPLELWDCYTMTPLRTMSRKFPKISALEWSPTSHGKPRKDSASSQKDTENSEDHFHDTTPETPLSPSVFTASIASLHDIEDHTLIKETLVFTSIDGQLFHFSVKGNIFKDGTKIPSNSQRSMVTYIAWKTHKIVLSDTDGNISIWDLRSRAFRSIITRRGCIKKMRFAPGKDNMKLLVQYKDGVDIWDAKEVNLLAQLKSPKDCPEVVDIDWGASDSPVVAFVDGTVKVMDLTLKKSHSSMGQYCTKDPIASPYLLPPETSLNLRTMITHQPWKDMYSLTFGIEDGFTVNQLDIINEWISGLPMEVTTFLERCNSIMHRALVTAYLFGDKGEIDYWSVATYYLTMSVYREESMGEETHKNLNETEPELDQFPCVGQQLSSSFYHLCDNGSYRMEELERLYIHESKELPQTMKDTLGRKLSVVGEKDRVVRILLDADSTNTQFYTDCLRACLLSATHHSTQAQSTIKLVATNLIAAGNIYEGIELLCMIGKAADACRYLQSHGYWNDSIWLAKCVLPRVEAFDLIKHWAHNLSSSGSKDKAVCAYLAGGLTSSAVEHLVHQHYHPRAALMLQVLEQLNLLTTTNCSQHSSTDRVCLSPTLKENTYRKYALYLIGLGNAKAGDHFCEILRESGNDLLSSSPTTIAERP